MAESPQPQPQDDEPCPTSAKSSLIPSPPQSSVRGSVLESLRVLLILSAALLATAAKLISSHELMWILSALALPTDATSSMLGKMLKRKERHHD